jgi:hypothetical protein
VASALHAICTPYSTSVSVPLYAITALSITNQRTSSGVGISLTFLPHVIIPDKRHGVHWKEHVEISKIAAQMWYIFPCVIPTVVIQNPQGYIFRILQHFATKLCNFTNFSTLFLAVVMDFVLLA